MGQYESKSLLFFSSETLIMITVTIKSVFFIINTLSPPLCEILNAVRIKLFAVVLQLCFSLSLSAS